MKMVTVVLALLALIAGLKAAWHWYQSSLVAPNVEAGDGGKYAYEISQIKTVLSILSAASRSADLNKIAARWTAASVVLGGASNIAGTFG
jgi:hypothetical protein